MSKSTKNAKAVVTPAAAKRATQAKRAPGNAKALEAKAADNLAKLAKRTGKAEAIKSVVGILNSSSVAVTTSRDRTVVIKRMDATTTKLAVIGAPVAPLEEYLRTQPKPQAKLANGVDSRTAPQSAKAVADQAKGAKAPKATKTPKGAKAKAPSKGVDRAYKVGSTKNTAKPGTWRHHMLTVIQSHKDTASAKAAHAKGKAFTANKLDFNWVNAQGYIVFAK
jgi:hypothetical protein